MSLCIVIAIDSSSRRQTVPNCYATREDASLIVEAARDFSWSRRYCFPKSAHDSNNLHMSISRAIRTRIRSRDGRRSVVIEESCPQWRRSNHEQRSNPTDNTRPEEGGTLTGGPSEVAEGLVPEVRLERCDGWHCGGCVGTVS